MKFISDYREGQPFSGTYLCKSKQTLKTKAGKNYDSLVLQDKTGSVDAKIWEYTSGIADYDASNFIHVEGMVTSFQGNLQVNITRVRVSDEGEYEIADYIPTTTKNRKEMYEEIVRTIKSFTNPYLKELASSFYIKDQEFIKVFCSHSAAKNVHHSFMGGLLEHTLSIVNLCEYFSSAYPIINRELLICAALFHDLGKTHELSSFPENDYTDDGQLLGHIFIGAEKVTSRIREIPGFPKKLENELIHCILAHHGELEYGSPKKPALVEAIALNLADNADAKLQTLTEIFAAAGDNNDWLGYNRLFESNLRRSAGSDCLK